MAHFRAIIGGNRSTASRLGTKETGIAMQGNGWNFGVEVDVFYNHSKQRDEAKIILTYGSSRLAASPRRLLGLYTRKGDRLVKVSP